MDNIVSTLGAGSGIDTRALTDSLVNAERAARTTPLTARGASLDARISALGQVRSALQGIASSLDSRVRAGGLGLVPASSNAGSVAIDRLGAGPATAFAANVTVNRLASAQQLSFAPLASAAAPVGLGTLTIGFGTRSDNEDGSFAFAGTGSSVDIVIDASNNSLTGLRDAINRAGTSVTASIVSNADNATLVLRGAEGAANGFIVSAAPAADDAGLLRFSATPGRPTATLRSRAADADLSLDGVAVSRASNLIDDLVPGTRIRLLRADPAATTVLSAARDPTQLEATVSDVAGTLGALRSLLGDLRRGATGSDAGGALAADPTARTIDQRLAGLVAAPVAAANGLRLRDLGVSVDRAGVIGFDPARLAALPPTRLGDAEALLRSLAAPALSTQPGRLLSIAELVTPASAGLARARATVTTGLAAVDTRLATYRSQLTQQFAAMDRLVAASRAVGAQLTQLLNARKGRNDN